MKREEAIRFMNLSRPLHPVSTRKQYLRLAKQMHPDRPNGNKVAFQKLEEAMCMLRDAYDSPLHSADVFTDDELRDIDELCEQYENSDFVFN